MSMVQIVSYGFTTTENPLSDGGLFSTMTTYGNLKVPSSGVCEPASTSQNANETYTGACPPGDTGGTWPADQYAEITVGTINSIGFFGPGVRMNAAGTTGYIVAIQGGSGGTVYKISGSGTYTSIGTFAATSANGDVWRMTIVGTTITITQNTVSKFSGTDASFASGTPGFYQEGTAVTDSKMSLFAAGANQAAAPTASPGAGSYTTPQTVTLSSTSGGTIFYTRDGSTPTRSSSSVSSGGTISVSSSQTLKAIAGSISNTADSPIFTAVYTFAIPNAQQSGAFLVGL